MPVLPFVGRADLLAELTAALADARAGRGGLTVLTGAAGAGKTRVAEEAVRRVEGFRTLWLWCPPQAAAEPTRSARGRRPCTSSPPPTPPAAGWSGPHPGCAPSSRPGPNRRVPRPGASRAPATRRPPAGASAPISPSSCAPPPGPARCCSSWTTSTRPTPPPCGC
ncbi:AAA family ATPase [Kitasatospora aburaviensis]